MQEFEQLSAKRKSTSAADADVHLGHMPSSAKQSEGGLPSDFDNTSDASSSEDDEQEGDEQEDDDDVEEDEDEEDPRHEAMLAEVRGAVGDPKRKRAVVASEAYPDSEYNLPPTSTSAGERCCKEHQLVLVFLVSSKPC